MAATIEMVRDLALALPGVEEGICFGTPAFYLRSKLMLRLREDGETLVTKFPAEEREAAIERAPDVFSITDHYRDHPVILVDLLAVDPGTLAALIEGAWRMLASSKQIAARDVGSGASAEQADAGGDKDQRDPDHSRRAQALSIGYE